MNYIIRLATKLKAQNTEYTVLNIHQIRMDTYTGKSLYLKFQFYK